MLWPKHAALAARPYDLGGVGASAAGWPQWPRRPETEMSCPGVLFAKAGGRSCGQRHHRAIDANGAHKRGRSLSLLGVCNRNPCGVYPSPETVDNFGPSLLSVGFSSGEANHEGACNSCSSCVERVTCPSNHST